MKALLGRLLAALILMTPGCVMAGTVSGVAGTLDATLVDPAASLYPHFICQSGCTGSGSAAATHAQSGALAASLVAKAGAGTLFSFTVSADSTLDAAAWYVMIFDAASLPADGAVTPAKCYYVPAGQATFGGTFGAGGVSMATGITLGVSTAGCFSKTASTHALFIGADYQ